MDLSTLLLILAIIAGLLGGMSARFRSWGTSLADLGTGLVAVVLFAIVSVVVLILTVGLDRFGIIHLVYLFLVVAFPLAVAIIVIPHFLNAEFKTPIVAQLLTWSALAVVGVGVWSTHIEPTRLVIEEEILGIAGAKEPLVIGVIADLQTGSIGDYENRARAEVLDRDPDVVVLPGDLFQIEDDLLAERLPEFLGWLRELQRQVDHVVMVNGDVDDPQILRDFAAETGVHYLHDDLLELEVNDQRVFFAGFAVRFEETEEEAEALANEVSLQERLLTETVPGDAVIAVSHYPDVVFDLPNNTTVDLIIAGHTHGGQVSIPGFGPPITLTNVPREVAAGGLHVVNGHPLYVSTGVGLERGQAPQLRFRVRPSVALLTVVPS